MPGFRFVGEKSQHSFHTYVWLFIHVVALLISYIYIKEEYINWQTTPAIRTLSNNLTMVSEIPFPAVTFCTPYTMKSGYDFVGSLEKCLTCDSAAGDDCVFNSECDREEVETLAVAAMLCQFQGAGNVTQSPAVVFTRDVSKSIDGERFTIYAKKVFPPCDYTIKQRLNKNKEFVEGCDRNGFQHFIAYGAYQFCTTVNGLRHEDVYKENVVLSIPLQPSPYYQNYVGEKMTLENMLYFKGGNDTIPVYFTEEDYFTYHISKRNNLMHHNVCNFFSLNELASVTLHNPAEIPLVQDLERMINIDKYNYMKIIPNLVTTKKDLIGYSPSQRGCYYSNERELMLFKSYSKNKCEYECYANCSLRSCNCIPPYLPRPNISYRVCITDCDVNCDCGCLPDCVSLSYDFVARKETKDTNGSGVLEVYYKDKNFYPMIRVGISDLANFMAYSFGILGTFNGFSVMVIFELFYFMTIRLWSSIKNIN
jgi:hypothetical protein